MYAIHNEIGAGTFSKVYLANKKDTSDTKQYAIKILEKKQLLNNVNAIEDLCNEVLVM